MVAQPIIPATREAEILKIEGQLWQHNESLSLHLPSCQKKEGKVEGRGRRKERILDSCIGLQQSNGLTLSR